MNNEIQIVNPSYKIIWWPDDIMKNLEFIGRVCYKSEDKICDGSDEDFLESIMKKGHESIIEHANITVKFVCDRGVSHELVRHRLCAFTQKSTRYVNCNHKGFEFIPPVLSKPKFREWYYAMKNCGETYQNLEETPQISRSVLPNSLQTEIFLTTNLREWKHIFKMRCHVSAHPQMREIMIPLLNDFYYRLPILFGDLKGLIDLDSLKKFKQFRHEVEAWVENLKEEEKNSY